MTDVDKKKIEKYRNLILDIPGINSAEYINSTTSSVTLSWGVEWLYKKRSYRTNIYIYI